MGAEAAATAKIARSAWIPACREIDSGTKWCARFTAIILSDEATGAGDSTMRAEKPGERPVNGNWLLFLV